MSEIKFTQMEFKKMKGIELTDYEKQLLKALEKPKYSIKDLENHFIKKGMNPYAPWMEKDHKRIQDILDKKEIPCLK
jgi:hypothetical protein